MNIAAEPKERTRKSIKNVIFGVAAQIITVLFNMWVRKAVVACLGIEYAGLNGLFNEVIAIMAMSELGIGTAITYAMYKPLAENDTEKLAALMNLFRRAYRIIFVVVAATGLALCPIIHLLVKDTDFTPDYIRVVFLLFAAKTAVSYLFSYKTALVNADQRMFVTSIIGTVIRVLAAAANLVIIYTTRNFLIYLCAGIFFTLAQNIAVSVYVDRHYSFLKTKAALSKPEKKSIFQNIGNIFIGRVSGKITNSTDNILISLLVSTAAVGYYSNYALIISSLLAIVTVLQSGFSAGIGNMMAVDEPGKCSEVLVRLTFLASFIGCVGGVCLYCLMTPFVALWLGGEYAISQAAVFFLSLNFFFSTARLPLWTVMQNSGLFAKDRNISIIGSSVNLAVSLLAGWKFGMTGIFIGTTCTQVIQIVLKIILLYRRRFELPAVKYLLYWLLWVVLTVAMQFGCGWLCSTVTIGNAYLAFIVQLLAALLIPAAILCAIFRNTNDFKYYIWLIKKTLTSKKTKVASGGN